MSKDRSQQEIMAKSPTDLEESWFTGPKDISNDWVIIGEEFKSVGDEEPKEDLGNESETDPLIEEKKKKEQKSKGVSVEKKVPQKLRKKRPAKALPELPSSKYKDMAVGWLRKAAQSLGPETIFGPEVPDVDYRSMNRNINWGRYNL